MQRIPETTTDSCKSLAPPQNACIWLPTNQRSGGNQIRAVRTWMVPWDFWGLPAVKGVVYNTIPSRIHHGRLRPARGIQTSRSRWCRWMGTTLSGSSPQSVLFRKTKNLEKNSKNSKLKNKTKISKIFKKKFRKWKKICRDFCVSFIFFWFATFHTNVLIPFTGINSIKKIGKIFV